VPDVGADTRSEGQYGNHESGHKACGLDVEKPTLAASERREEEQARWREQMKEMDETGLTTGGDHHDQLFVATIS